MEEGECLYSKYGYCKYKEQCTRKHYKEKCEELGDCKGVRVCPKRHPKACKRINTEKGCNFGNECAYKHTNLHETQKKHPIEWEKKVEALELQVNEMADKLVSTTEGCELKEKVKLIEAVIKNLFQNVIRLDKEISELKTKSKSEDITEKTLN